MLGALSSARLELDVQEHLAEYKIIVIYESSHFWVILSLGSKSCFYFVRLDKDKNLTKISYASLSSPADTVGIIATLLSSFPILSGTGLCLPSDSYLTQGKIWLHSDPSFT